MAKVEEKEPVLVYSERSGPFEKDGHEVEVHIYKIEGSDEWILEVVDGHGTSTVWDDVFPTDEDAWLVFMKTIEEEGIEPLVEPIDSTVLH